jgi:hypothetical protein
VTSKLRLSPRRTPRLRTGLTRAQTMRHWAGDVAHVAPGASILVVTSSIYVPFQHAVALQHLGLPFRARVETVGVDHTVIDPNPLPQVFRAVNYLQELRSAIRAYRQLASRVEAEGEAS